MSAEIDLLRNKLNALETAVNQQSEVKAVRSAITDAKKLLDARDVQEANGMTLAPLDATVLANMHTSISAAVTALNNKTVTFDSLADITAELAALGGS